MSSIARLFPALLLTTAILAQAPRTLAAAHQPAETIARGHLVVVYRDGTVPRNADDIAALVGARARHIPRLGLSALQISGDEDLAIAKLLAQPEVATVLHDRYVTGHALIFSPQQTSSAKPDAKPLPGSPVGHPPVNPIEPINPISPIGPVGPPTPGPTPVSAWPMVINRPSPINPVQPIAPTPVPINGPLPVNPLPIPVPINGPLPITSLPLADSYYNSPQGWAVQQAGGYGNNIPGGSATGPWNTSMGAGVRIAILDSGVDENHPDIAPNLAFNLSEIDQFSMPSPCDDGSPQDQQGHGTWTASLAAGAIGGGATVGMAPQATLLNIKVLQRMPGSGASTLSANCEAGEPGGLLSWVLEGIADAMVQHANVISMSLGTLIDITTTDGAGWQAQFNSVTYAAFQNNVILVAALGNDGVNLTRGNSNYREMPAQSRDVLAVYATANPDCAEELTPGATCTSGPFNMASYSNYSISGGANNNNLPISAPGGNYPQGPGLSDPSAPTGFITGACSNGLTNTTDGLPANGQSFGCFGIGHASYTQAIGTSASGALTAGAVAILRAAHPNWTSQKVLTVLHSTVSIPILAYGPQLNLPVALVY